MQSNARRWEEQMQHIADNQAIAAKRASEGACERAIKDGLKEADFHHSVRGSVFSFSAAAADEYSYFRFAGTTSPPEEGAGAGD